MAREYTPGRYFSEKRFLLDATRSGVEVGNIFKHVETKRELLRLLYDGLKGRGGEHIPMGRCTPERIGKAFRSIYRQAESNAYNFKRRTIEDAAAEKETAEQPGQLELFSGEPEKKPETKPQYDGCGCMNPDGV